MEEFIPIDMLIRANRVKYKYLAFPALVIIINFIFSITFPALYTQYGSFMALGAYFFILYVFRFNKEFQKFEEDVVIAPMNGKIIKITEVEEGHLITIKKPFFDSCEFVTCTKHDIPNTSIQDIKNKDISHVCWKINCATAHIFINNIVNYQATLIGLVPGNAVCEVFIPKRYNLEVAEGGIIEAGYSEIGVLNENYGHD
ncbi:MAG: hypothetical protein FWG98_03120 [Candidatus Cloacimonetes bacterium]|nr:hypothetical protein [Candidatus Cloacimonadota bacterium]